MEVLERALPHSSFLLSGCDPIGPVLLLSSTAGSANESSVAQGWAWRTQGVSFIASL